MDTLLEYFNITHIYSYTLGSMCYIFILGILDLCDDLR
nr:MAG TPA: hypothetical protein [Ackermannviridae sp.]DAN71879.1 MAG TPA: hypothetical protein [Caudoviricetes sp.]DAU73249.1 MAG TPA: hypothetical protein [Caudoviricetes sp.]